MNPNQERVGYCDNSEVGPPLSPNNDAVEKVFSNTLLWKIIGSYLNVGDLKACRLVNSGFHGMIMKETNFLKRCLVSLEPDQITRNIFGSTSEQWKNVVLKFQSPGEGSYCNFSDEDLENLDWLYPVISSVESLSLRMKEGTKGGNVFRLLKLLLKAPKKLRSLAVEPIFLIIGMAGQFEEVKAILENLEEFEILEPSPRWLFDVGEVIKPVLVASDFIKQLKNLRVVKSYYPRPQMHDALRYIKEPLILTNVLNKIAIGSSKTLKCVTLGASSTGPFDIIWPRIDIVRITPAALLSPSPGPIIKFLEGMPMLEELEILLNMRKFPWEILDAIEEKSGCLRKLKLEGAFFHGKNWEFLEKSKLEEFQLGAHSLPNSFDSGVLPSAAQNYWPSTIKRLCMQGLLESNPVPALTRLDPTLVTQITFIDSGNCLEDDAIKYICGNFVMLRKLNVTNVKRVTDAGFIGSSSGSGSLSGVKGLRTLVLSKCGSITDATLKEIRFLELSYLDLSYNENLTEAGLEDVLSNNSSLETLVTSCGNVYRKREQLRASRQIQDCHVSNLTLGQFWAWAFVILNLIIIIVSWIEGK